MPVRGRDLPALDHLDRTEQGPGGPSLEGWVVQDKHPALRFFRRNELAGFEERRTDVVGEIPERRLAVRHWLAWNGLLHDRPERGQAAFRDARVIGVTGLLKAI